MNVLTRFLTGIFIASSLAGCMPVTSQPPQAAAVPLKNRVVHHHRRHPGFYGHQNAVQNNQTACSSDGVPVMNLMTGGK